MTEWGKEQGSDRMLSRHLIKTLLMYSNIRINIYFITLFKSHLNFTPAPQSTNKTNQKTFDKHVVQLNYPVGQSIHAAALIKQQAKQLLVSKSTAGTEYSLITCTL